MLCTGYGVLYSSSVVHRSPDPVTHPAPYTVAVVTLDEGPSLLTRLRPGATARPGARVRVGFVPSNGRQLYEFEVIGP
jgi:uncharacterized OB-fold protein